MSLGPGLRQPDQRDALLQGRDALVALQQAITTNDLVGGTLVKNASSTLSSALLPDRPGPAPHLVTVASLATVPIWVLPCTLALHT